MSSPRPSTSALGSARLGLAARDVRKRTPPASPVLLALVVASGAAGLAYEVSWSRQLGLTFGQTARAAAIVLAAYFLGMAVGYALAGPRSARMRQPLVGYALAEVAVGAWALLLPGLLGLLPDAIDGGLSRVLVALLVLLPGTTALGASLPFVAQAAAAGSDRAGTSRVATVYAANLAGAVLGVVASTAMLPTVGVVTTSLVAAAGSLLVGAVAWSLRSRFEAEAPAPPATAPREPGQGREAGIWLLAAAVSGLGSLGAQVLYVRLFSLVFHNSTYTFAAILLVVLLSLSIASTAAGWALQRYDARALLVGASLVAAATLPLSVSLFVQIQGLAYFAAGGVFAGYLAASALLVAAVVLVPVLAMGLVLPLAWHLAGADARPGPVVGRLTTANTLAAAAGAIGASFLLLPGLGLWSSFAALAVPYLALAIVVGWPLARHRRRLLLGVAVASGVLVASTLLSRQHDGLGRDEFLIARYTGPYGWTDVTRDADDYHRRLQQNLHYGLGSRSSSAMQLRQGQFPLALHPAPEKVAFIGLATGVTASAALERPEIAQITVMELIPEVVEAARWFTKENRGLLDDPRVSLIVGDGRRLLGASDERYDVIVADLFVPWESKTGYLYTVEHFAAVRRRLAEDGVFVQWLAGWQVGGRELDVVANSLHAAFEHVALWQLSRHEERPLFALVGVPTPRRFSRADLEARLSARRPPPRGRERVLEDVDDLVATYVGDWRRLPDVPLNTDEHPIVEFSAPVTHVGRDRRLREAGFHAYDAARLAHLPREVFTFDPPARPDERMRPK